MIAGYLRKTLRKKEQEELQAWIHASDRNSRLFKELTDLEAIEKRSLEFDRPDDTKALERIKKKIHFTISKKETLVNGPFSYLTAYGLNRGL